MASALGPQYARSTLTPAHENLLTILSYIAHPNQMNAQASSSIGNRATCICLTDPHIPKPTSYFFAHFPALLSRRD